MEIKELLNGIKQTKSNICLGENTVDEIKIHLNRALGGVNVEKIKLSAMMDELDELIRGGDETAYIDKMELEGCEIKVRKSSPAVVITDDARLEPEFLTFVPAKPNKGAIKEALEGGEEVAGAEMREETYKLVVETV